MRLFTTPGRAWCTGLATLTLSVLLLPTASAQMTIHNWNFNEGNTGVDGNQWPSPIPATRSFGYITHIFLTEGDRGTRNFAGSTINAVDGDVAGGSFSVEGDFNNGRYFTLFLSTRGYEVQTFSYATRGTSTGFNSQLAEYSVDHGETWHFLGEETGSRVTTFFLVSYSLEGITGVNDNPDFRIRITLDGATSAAGNNRFDNITLRGILMPDHRRANREEAGPSGWRMLSAPVPGLQVADLIAHSLVQGISDEYPQGAANVYVGYVGDSSENSAEVNNGFEIPAGRTESLESGRGFIWYLWDDQFDPQAAGGLSASVGTPLDLVGVGIEITLQDHQVVFTEDDRAASDDGFFLLGNPFAEVFGVGGVTASSGMVSNVFHRWNPALGGGAGGYEMYLASMGHNVAVWDGFFAEISGSTLPLTVTYLEHCRCGCGIECAGGELRPVSETTDHHIVALVLGGTVGGVAAYDEAAMVAFTSEATEDWDRFDGSKLNPIGSMWATISPMGLRDGELTARSVNSLPIPTDRVTVPVAFSARAGGEFTISLGAHTDVPDGWMIELEDRVSGQTVDLRTTSVSFATSEETSMEDRFAVHVTTTAVSVDDGAGVLEFTLGGAYPNPFSGASTLAFTLPATSDISLAVYDVLGRQVAVLADGEHAAGRHSVTIDGSSLAAGVYVVRLAAGEYVAARRLTVVH
jgi:hypothetical protein